MLDIRQRSRTVSKMVYTRKHQTLPFILRNQINNNTHNNAVSEKSRNQVRGPCTTGKYEISYIKANRKIHDLILQSLSSWPSMPRKKLPTLFLSWWKEKLGHVSNILAFQGGCLKDWFLSGLSQRAHFQSYL